jgi:hypothetical protein
MFPSLRKRAVCIALMVDCNCINRGLALDLGLGLGLGEPLGRIGELLSERSNSFEILYSHKKSHQPINGIIMIKLTYGDRKMIKVAKNQASDMNSEVIYLFPSSKPHHIQVSPLLSSCDENKIRFPLFCILDACDWRKAALQ